MSSENKNCAGVVDLFPGASAPPEDSSEPFDYSAMGRTAEFFVSFVISELGNTVHHVPANGYDLIVEVDGGLLRVQVKSSATVRGKTPVYAFTTSFEKGNGRTSKRVVQALTDKQCDIVAFAALELRRVIFIPVADVDCTRMSVPVSEFMMPGIERASWARSLEAVESLKNSAKILASEK